jgi:hypothetical protein
VADGGVASDKPSTPAIVPSGRGDETILPGDETISRFGADMRKRCIVINPATKRRALYPREKALVMSMFTRIGAVATLLCVLLAGSAHGQVGSLMKFSDPRDEFVRQCVPHMQGRWAHPESVCGCLHDYAVASIDDSDLRQALLRGISETGVPNIESDWVPTSKRSEISATFTRIAKPTLQCMFAPKT